MLKRISAILLASAALLCFAPITAHAEFDGIYDKTMEEYKEVLSGYLENADVDTEGKNALLGLIENTSDIRLNQQQWSTPMEVESLPILNLEFAALADNVSALKVGETVTLEIPKFQSGYSTDLKTAFGEAYGDLSGKRGAVDGIPDGITMESIMGAVTLSRDALVNEYKTTSSFESVKSAISVGDIFSAAGSAISSQSAPKTYKQSDLQQELDVMTQGFAATHTASSAAGIAKIKELAQANRERNDTGFSASIALQQTFEETVEKNSQTVQENLPTCQDLIDTIKGTPLKTPDYGTAADFDTIDFVQITYGDASSEIYDNPAEYWLEQADENKGEAVRLFFSAYLAKYGRQYIEDHPDDTVGVYTTSNIAPFAKYIYSGVYPHDTYTDSKHSSNMLEFSNGELNDGVYCAVYNDINGDPQYDMYNFRSDIWTGIQSTPKSITFELQATTTNLKQIKINYFMYWDPSTKSYVATHTDIKSITVYYGITKNDMTISETVTASATTETKGQGSGYEHASRTSVFNLSKAPTSGVRYVKIEINNARHHSYISEIEIYAGEI